MKRSQWMKTLFGVFLFAVTFQNGWGAPARISGRVENMQTGQVIPAANIYIENSSIGVMSDGHGEFTLDIPADISGMLVVRAIGYAVETYSIDDAEERLMVRLKPQAIDMEPVSITALRGGSGKSPITYSSISEAELKLSDTQRDVPELLSNLPSASFYSENGNGIGYSYLTLRGFDQRRISVMVNGIPQNDPEDHNVYWINFHDLVNSLTDIQVQRGAGSAFYGPAAIGGSINLVSRMFNPSRGYRIQSTIGSYDTKSLSAELSSGLVNEHWNGRFRYSRIESDGYRKGSWTKYERWFGGLGYFTPDFNIKFISYGGPQEDGLAYYGIPKSYNEDDALRRENWSAYTGDVEVFNQPHFELHSTWQINDRWSLDNAFFYIYGKGYFDYDGSWAPPSYYRLTENIGSDVLIDEYIPAGVDVSSAAVSGDAMIRAWVLNQQGGCLPRINYSGEHLQLTAGLELRYHQSLHWGRLESGSLQLVTVNGDTLNESIPVSDDADPYYQYRGAKEIISAYIHSNYQLSDRMNLMADVQMAYKNYRLFEEKYIGNEFEIPYRMINPRLGLNFFIRKDLNVYINASRTTREPRLKNYYDAAEATTPPDWGEVVPNFDVEPVSGVYDFSQPNVHPETLYDYELGSQYERGTLKASMNAYWMIFNDEIVKNGKLDRFGYPVTGNADQTLHQGLEFSLQYSSNQFLSGGINGSFSRDIFLNYSLYEYDENYNVAETVLDGNTINGFPGTLFNGFLQISHPASKTIARLEIKYVGSYFTSNTESAAEKVDAFAYLNARIIQDMVIGRQLLSLSFHINNVLNDKIILNGIGSDYFPLATRNYLLSLDLYGLI